MTTDEASRSLAGSYHRDMNILSATMALACILAVSGEAIAAQRIFECPQSIPETSVQVTAPTGAWKPFVASPWYLGGAAPADGPPERLGVLHEQETTHTKSGWTRKYQLNGQYPKGKWLRCDYGALGEVSLAKRLPDAIRECTVTGKKGAHAGEMQLTIQCH